MYATALTFVLASAAAIVAAKNPAPLLPRSGVLLRDLTPPGLSGRSADATCADIGEADCGYYCIYTDYICCSGDGGYGCPSDSYCASDSGTYGCCPLGEICVGGGGIDTQDVTVINDYTYTDSYTDDYTYSYTYFSYTTATTEVDAHSTDSAEAETTSHVAATPTTTAKVAAHTTSTATGGAKAATATGANVTGGSTGSTPKAVFMGAARRELAPVGAGVGAVLAAVAAVIL